MEETEMSDDMKKVETEEKEVNYEPSFVAEIIDDEAHTKIDTVTGFSINNVIFTACVQIYDKYSDHKEKFPSFKNIEAREHSFFGDNMHVMFKAFDKSFTLKFTKAPDSYTKLTENDIVSELYIEDNMVRSGISIEPIKNTVYEINPIIIPYGFLDATEDVYMDANNTSFKDLHDTIFGFSLITNISFSAEANCAPEDVFCYEDGLKIAYKKCLRQKIDYDIKNYQVAVQQYKEQLNKYSKLITSTKRTIRRCRKSQNKIRRELNK